DLIDPCTAALAYLTELPHRRPRTWIPDVERLHAPSRGDRYEPRSLALRRFAAECDQTAEEVHVAEAERQHLALAHTCIKRGDDHRTQPRRSNGQQVRFFVVRNPPPPLVVLAQLSNQRLCSAPERRSVDVLASDRPVHHVAYQLDRAVHRRR